MSIPLYIASPLSSPYPLGLGFMVIGNPSPKMLNEKNPETSIILMVHYPMNPKLLTIWTIRLSHPFHPWNGNDPFVGSPRWMFCPPVHHLVILAVTSTVMIPQCLYCNPCIIPHGSCHQLLIYHAFPPEHWKHPQCKKFWERETTFT